MRLSGTRFSRQGKFQCECMRAGVSGCSGKRREASMAGVESNQDEIQAWPDTVSLEDVTLCLSVLCSNGNYNTV